ncbi:hypothetical protein ABIB30_000490 [Pedobacter sp. UYP1]
MSRLKQNQNIDSVIQFVEAIAQNQCFPSDGDRDVLKEVLERLRILKRKKGKTNKQIRAALEKITALLLIYFV